MPYVIITDRYGDATTVHGADELNALLRTMYGDEADTIREASYPDRLVDEHGEAVALLVLANQHDEAVAVFVAEEGPHPKIRHDVIAPVVDLYGEPDGIAVLIDTSGDIVEPGEDAQAVRVVDHRVYACPLKMARQKIRREYLRRCVEKDMSAEFAALVEVMDDDIRETVHAKFAHCSKEKFLTEYQKRHEAKHGSSLSV